MAEQQWVVDEMRVADGRWLTTTLRPLRLGDVVDEREVEVVRKQPIYAYAGSDDPQRMPDGRVLIGEEIVHISVTRSRVIDHAEAALILRTMVGHV